MQIERIGKAKLITGDNVTSLRQFPDDFVDLTVTSPPYDNLRTYKGFTWDFEALAKELYRVTKPGVVWVVGDATVKGSETGTSFRQALFFKDVCGFNLHDTMIYSKGAQGGAKGSNYAYTQSFEYMFVLSKGKPEHLNLLRDRKNAYQAKQKRSTMRKEDGRLETFTADVGEFSKRTNVWEIRGGYMISSTDKESFEHPATFPEALANDHILSWSNEGDVVLDPFMGSGTTGKMALLNSRKFIGIELSPEYVEIARNRIQQAEQSLNQP